ncbi:UNVERIFIED_CONTAM: hypothetical protein FKN15_065435 [Acipenser sinensis]
MELLFEAMNQQQSLLMELLSGPPVVSVPRVQTPSPDPQPKQEDSMSLTASEGMDPQELIFPSEDAESAVLAPTASKDQRLVYSGRLLLDHFQLRDVFRKNLESGASTPTSSRSQETLTASTSTSTSTSTEGLRHRNSQQQQTSPELSYASPDFMQDSHAAWHSHWVSHVPYIQPNANVVVAANVRTAVLHAVDLFMDDGLGEDSGDDTVEDPNMTPHPGFLASAWSFIITFFTSLIPEGPPHAAN